MQNLIYGIWKNDIAKRKAIWEDVMKETLNFFDIVKQQAEKQIDILIKKNIILNKEDMETCDVEFTKSILDISKIIYENLERFSSSVQFMIEGMMKIQSQIVYWK